MSIYCMTRPALHFLGRRISSASIHYRTDTWVLRAKLVSLTGEKLKETNGSFNHS
jgi:hypothetical protein